MADMFKTAEKLFSDTPQIRVPIFQRSFTWQGAQVEQLLNDIELISVKHEGHALITPTSMHFCGLLVFVKHSEGTVYEVVDGQQRLSTLVLIAATAKDVISEYLSANELPQEDVENLTVAKTYFNEFIYRELKPYRTKVGKLTPNTEDESLYKELVMKDGTIASKTDAVQTTLGKLFLRKRYFKAYETIHDYLSDRVRAVGKIYFADFLVKMTRGLTFIEFAVNKEEDAFNLFETLNDRGIGLSAMDLIKNKVLQNADGNLEEFTLLWNAVFGKDGIIDASKAQPFLRNYLMSREGHITNDVVYEKCKGYLASPANTKEFLDDINKDASYFRNILSPREVAAEGDTDIAEHLLLLGKTRVRQWHSLGYCAYGLYKDEIMNKAELLDILHLLLNRLKSLSSG